MRNMAEHPASRQYGPAAALILCLALITAGCADPSHSTPPGVHIPPDGKPNIIWILLDACRADNLSCYGYPRETSPNLDQLADRGVLFEQHYSQATWTVPSTASYMTGRYFAVPSIGQYGYTPGSDTVKLPPDNERLLPEILGQNGYQTVMITLRSAWFTRRHRLPRAFHRFIDIEPKKPPHVSFDELNGAVGDYLVQPRSKPFFLYLHAFDTHFPHHLSPPFDRWIDKDFDTRRVRQNQSVGARAAGGVFTTEDQEYLRALYDGSIAYADTHIGHLFDRLEALGLLENTLIIVGSDHGEALGEDGETVSHGSSYTYDEVTHVPLIIAGPGIPAGERVLHLTENVDIVPTLLDLLDIHSPARMDGESLLPWIGNPDPPLADEQVFVKGRIGPVFSLRNTRFKYEFNIGDGTEHLYPVPDHLATRTDVIEEHRTRAAEMKQALVEKQLALWEEYSQLPLMAVFLPAEKMFAGGEEGAVRMTRQPPQARGKEDGKWALYNGQLFSASFAEQAPPLAFRRSVPPGQYSVLIDLYVEESFAGHPASSVAVKLKGQAGFETISRTPGPEESAGFAWTRIGTCDVDDGLFEATVAQGDDSFWAGFKGFVLLPRTAEAEAGFDTLMHGRVETREDDARRIERLKALGYLQ